MSELDKAKHTLYRALLDQDPDQLTQNEIDLCFVLSKDPSIQTTLTNFFKEPNP